MTKKNTKELITYLLVGVLTTLVNYAVYYFLIQQFSFGWLLSNTVAWMMAVVFAFVANRKIVFQSENNIYREALLFVVLRLITLFIENCLLFICIQTLHIDMMFSKIIVSFITVLSNYILCKQQIFQTHSGGIRYEKN